jgi:hypothetical protein
MARAPLMISMLIKYNGDHAAQREAAFKRLSKNLEKTLTGSPQTWDGNAIAAMLREATAAMRETERILEPDWRPVA